MLFRWSMGQTKSFNLECCFWTGCWMVQLWSRWWTLSQGNSTYCSWQCRWRLWRRWGVCLFSICVFFITMFGFPVFKAAVPTMLCCCHPRIHFWCQHIKICPNSHEFCIYHYTDWIFIPYARRILCEVVAFTPCIESLRTPFGATCENMTKDDIQWVCLPSHWCAYDHLYSAVHPKQTPANKRHAECDCDVTRAIAVWQVWGVPQSLTLRQADEHQLQRLLYDNCSCTKMQSVTRVGNVW